MSSYYSKSDITYNTPSRKDNISETEECKFRKEGVKFISNSSTKLGLRYDTIATAVVFFHRFYMEQSFKNFKKFVVATACLLLAGKVEETPKKTRDLLKTVSSLLKTEEWSDFGDDPKDTLFIHERVLLQAIKFDLNVSHPYSFLLKFAKGLKGDKTKLEKLVQAAWNFINDSMVTTLCLQWAPAPAAIAFLYLAAKVSKHDLQDPHNKKSWWLKFVNDVDQHDLEDICGIVLGSYDEDEMEKEGINIVEVAHSNTKEIKTQDDPSPLRKIDITPIASGVNALLTTPSSILASEEQLQQLINSAQLQATNILIQSLASTQQQPQQSQNQQQPQSNTVKFQITHEKPTSTIPPPAKRPPPILNATGAPPLPYTTTDISHSHSTESRNTSQSGQLIMRQHSGSYRLNQLSYHPNPRQNTPNTHYHPHQHHSYQHHNSKW